MPSDQAPEPFPARLRRLREARGWSQRELARRCGLTQQTARHLEGPDANPTLRTLEAIAAALAVPVTELMEGERKG